MLNHTCNHIRAEGKYELIFKGDADLQIFADEDRIDQVVINLVNNAVKYAPNSRKIYLIAERVGKMGPVYQLRIRAPALHPKSCRICLTVTTVPTTRAYNTPAWD